MRRTTMSFKEIYKITEIFLKEINYKDKNKTIKEADQENTKTHSS
jgi:hypothetical protein